MRPMILQQATVPSSARGFVFAFRILLGAALAAAAVPSADGRSEAIASPDGKISVVVGDEGGLGYEVSVDGKSVLTKSRLGLTFQNGLVYGPSAAITGAARVEHSGTWENAFGQRRIVPDCYRELRVQASQGGHAGCDVNLIVRAYDQGVAFRYEIPKQTGLNDYGIVEELSEFTFPEDYSCWAGNPSGCAENQYPKKRLSDVIADPSTFHVLPLLVDLRGGYAALAESDLLDWAGMFVSGAPSKTPKAGFSVKVALPQRIDGKGAVVGSERRISPWRVIMLARNAAELPVNDLVATLASPSRLADHSWVKPGVAAWDAWWTGVNPSQPESLGVYSRGDTRSHREYIDFAAEMGFRYQVMDWFWYEHMTLWDKGLNSPPNSPSGDFTRPMSHIDVPGLVAYAKERGIGLWIWAHSLDIKTFGMERALEHFAKLGLVGIKVDFFNNDSQETVQWATALLECAARHHLMVDLHGFYKPTGLARTYPNFITQEGVLGNEYNKLDGKQCDTLHTITLPFTRGLLGPMDFTPGGFLNRTAAEFKISSPTEVIGTRARQLAETVVYLSPLLVLCDSPSNYRGQPGVEFFRGLPTVWEESQVLSADVAGHIVVARRSGNRWYVAGMNGESPMKIRIPLAFLSEGNWKLNEFADPEAPTETATPVAVRERAVDRSNVIEISFQSAGGYAAVLTPAASASKF